MKDKFQFNTFLKLASHGLGLAAVFAVSAIIITNIFSSGGDEGASKIADSLAVSAKTLPVVIIDAGHGGEDGGAVAADGTCEKNINLAITVRLKELFELSGVECVMTREEDKMLSDGTSSTRKMQDLKARVELTGKYDNCVFVSIHQNKFPSEKCAGTQVYYSKNSEESQKLASSIQKAAKTYLQPDNERQIKAAGSEIFVLDRCQCPAVLVECGFLSNSGELKLLLSQEYQTKTAVVIFSAVFEQICEED